MNAPRRRARAGALAALACGFGAAAAPAQTPADRPDAARQVAAAVLALPDSLRASARVLGYAAGNRLVELRAGGPMVCLADDPADPRFHVACYHESLEPWMARGRALRAQGLGPTAVDSVRFADVAAGRIRMPAAASLYSLNGRPGSYDPATGAVSAAQPLFVIYLPFATTATTGLPSLPQRNAPWLMHPGQANAHVMFVPDMR